jgi:hypothetical protein
MANKKEFHFTPRGIAESDCAIHEPDYGCPAKGFGNPRGIYRVNLTIPVATARPLIKLITKAHSDNLKILVAESAKCPPASPAGRECLKPYEGDMPFVENEDGTVTFKIRRYASYIDPGTQGTKPFPLKVVDSKGKRIGSVPAIAGGSELKVKFALFPYGWSAVAGASVILQLDSVMLIKLVKPSTDASDDGWANEAVAHGYEANDRSASVKVLPLRHSRG